MNTDGCFKKTIQSGHNLTKKHIGKTSQMSKAAHAMLLKTKTGLEKVCKTPPQTFLWKRYNTLSFSPNLDRERSAKNIATH